MTTRLWNAHPESTGESLHVHGWDNPVSLDNLHISQQGQSSRYAGEFLSNDERIELLQIQKNGLLGELLDSADNWLKQAALRSCYRALWRCYGWTI